MNKSQMSNNINSSAPSSPIGTIDATNSIDQEVTDNQQPRLSRSRSLSDISQGDSPKGDQQQQTQRAAPQESLKVKIRTHNILNNNNNSTAKEGSSDTNNITKNNIPNNNKSNSESSNNKTSLNSNNKVSKSKANKASNLVNNNITSSKTSNSPKIQPENNTSVNNATGCPETNMNNHNDSASSAENGKSSAQPQPLFTQQPPQQNPPPPTAAQVQSQQQQLQPHPTPPSSQSTTQSQSPHTKQSPTIESNKPSKSPVASAEPKPKATRARKQPTASNKGANASNATPKPESKRTKKAKQNAENTSATKPVSVPSTQPLPTIDTSTPDNKNASNPQQSPTAPPATKKRKPRATAANSASTASTNEPATPTVSPPKRTRKKKGDQVVVKTDTNNNPPPPMTAASITIPPINVTNPQLLSVASNMPMGSSPMMANNPMLPSQQQQQPNINRQMPGISPLDAHDPANRYYSLTISPYANYDYGNAASLTRPSLSRLFTSSSSAEVGHSNSHSDELSKAFEDLRENSWNHLSKCMLEQASQFDIPSLIGFLYTIRSENDKLANKVRDYTQKRDQLIAMNARLELPGSSLISHLNQTSPNFSSAVAGLTNSPRSLPISSPSPAMNKSPIVPGSSYNHLPPANSLGPPGFIDRSSPLIGLPTPHSGVNSLKSSTISTPSPPTGALMAHGANNRASLMTVNNPPYVSNVHPSMNALNPLGGPNPASSSYYPRQ